MKRILLLLLLAGLGVGGWLYWKQTRAIGKVDAPELSTAQVESGPIELTVASTGRVVANLEVEIKCKASGEVVKLPFDVSQAVQKGKLLVELDPIDEERKVKQAEVTLAASQAKAKQAEEAYGPKTHPRLKPCIRRRRLGRRELGAACGIRRGATMGRSCPLVLGRRGSPGLDSRGGLATWGARRAADTSTPVQTTAVYQPPCLSASDRKPSAAEPLRSATGGEP